MQLNELGEFGLIGLIREKFASVSAAGYEGIGDDCAVMPCGDGTSLVVTTDMLIEEVHFRLCTTDPYRLGRKSLAVNLSDIAAMGAAPAAANPRQPGWQPASGIRRRERCGWAAWTCPRWTARHC